MDYAWGANGLDAIITQVLPRNCLNNLTKLNDLKHNCNLTLVSSFASLVVKPV